MVRAVVEKNYYRMVEKLLTIVEVVIIVVAIMSSTEFNVVRSCKFTMYYVMLGLVNCPSETHNKHLLLVLQVRKSALFLIILGVS